MIVLEPNVLAISLRVRMAAYLSISIFSVEFPKDQIMLQIPFGMPA